MKFQMTVGGPKPVAPFSHAVETDGCLFPTGQTPVSPDVPGASPESIVARTRVVMKHVKLVLAGVALGFEHVTIARAYFTRSEEEYAAMNETYRSFFPPDRLPARTCVGVTGLVYKAGIEIDLVCKRPRRPDGSAE